MLKKAKVTNGGIGTGWFLAARCLVRSERLWSGAVCHALLYITICELKTADLGPLQSIKPLLRSLYLLLASYKLRPSVYADSKNFLYCG